MLQIDPFELHSVVNGSVRLDGGAMFGVVPKVLWEGKTDVDEQNRILLATRTLLAIDRTANRVILVDTGAGTKWEPEAAERFDVKYDPEAIPRALAASGLGVADVTDVVVTHLHFDHNGGLTEWVGKRGGETALRYPKARHWIHETHLSHALHPHIKDRASFLREDFAILEGSKLLRLVQGDTPAPPFEGLEWFVSRGHTPYQLHPILGVGERRLLFVGDIVPTVAHLNVAWVMAYDLEPVRTIAEKQGIYSRCLDEGLLLAFPHDPSCGGVAVEGTVSKPIVTEELSLAV